MFRNGRLRLAEVVHAHARVHEALLAGERAPVGVPRFSTFCVDEYKPHAKLHLKPSTWLKRSSHVATLIEFFGDLRLDGIGDKVVDGFKRERRDAGLKNVSINNELRVLRKILLFARDERRIALVPPRMKFLPEAEKRPRVWTREEVQRLYVACKQTAPRLLPILVFLVNTGARRGEALALTWDRVDLERRIVKIWATDEIAEDDDLEEIPAWEPKNRRPREVPIADELLPYLSTKRRSNTWVFPAPETGKRYAFWPENQFQRIQKLAGLSGGVHTLRHTYASHFLQIRPDLPLLASILGHSHTRVTELYSHMLPEHLERARNVVALMPEVDPPATTSERVEEPAIAKARKRWKKAEVLKPDEPPPRRNVR